MKRVGDSSQPAAAARGFTLMELLVSMVASSALIVGIGSSLYIAFRATDPQLGGLQPRRDGSQVAASLLSELRFAESFIQRTATSAEFTVADQTGDSNPETIRYQWTGTPGDPLTRQFNGGAVVNVVEDVQNFNLDFRIKSVTTTETQTTTASSGEYLFSSFEGWPAITPTYQDFQVGSADWCAEFFDVSTIPNGASKVTITRCQLMLKQDQGGNLTVGIHRSKGGGNPEPANNSIGTPATVAVATLPTTYQWVEVTFSDVILQNVNKEFVIVVKGDTPNAARAQYLSSSQAPADNTVMLWTNSSGQKWDPKKNQRDENDMYFRIWGEYETTNNDPVTVTRHYVVSAGATLQVSSDNRARVESRTDILNRPEVSSP